MPRINGSTVLIRQLFSNLIQHSLSRKKSGTKHSIFLTSENTDCVDVNFPNKKYYRISSSDTGTVLNTDQLKKLFTFSHKSQAPNSYYGNGIGLSICKKIMEAHNGKIQAMASLKQGTIIQMYFPV